MTPSSTEPHASHATAYEVRRWPPGFRDRELEERYRRSFLARDRLVFLIPIFLLTVSNGVFALSDRGFTGEGSAFQGVLVIRIGFAVFSLLVLGVLSWSRSVSVTDTALFLWLLSACGLSLSLVDTRPPDYAPRVLMDGFFILVIFLMVPIRFILQCIPAWIMTAGSLWQVFLVMNLDPASLRSVLVVMVFGNVFGAWTAWRWHIDRRLQFARLLEEQRLREALERQRERGRMLEGLLPICAVCKSIRDDEGYWQRLEQYISERTNALFTHGICPECEQAVYSELDGRRR